jgi:hypothetical protein
VRLGFCSREAGSLLLDVLAAGKPVRRIKALKYFVAFVLESDYILHYLCLAVGS